MTLRIPKLAQSGERGLDLTSFLPPVAPSSHRAFFVNIPIDNPRVLTFEASVHSDLRVIAHARDGRNLLTTWMVSRFITMSSKKLIEIRGFPPCVASSRDGNVRDAPLLLWRGSRAHRRFEGDETSQATQYAGSRRGGRHPALRISHSEMHGSPTKHVSP